MKLNSLIAGLILMVAAASQSHAQTAGLVALAPHGGMVKEGQILNMELVVQGNDVFLYPLSRMGSAIPLQELKVSAIAVPPKKGKSKVELKPSDDHYKGTLVGALAPGYELRVEVAAKGKKDRFKFVMEKPAEKKAEPAPQQETKTN